MDLEALRYLLVVAEHKSFTRAATILGMRQSALSRHIRRLEQEFDSLLFYRDGRGARLTEAGEKLHEAGKAIFQSLAAVREELAADTAVLRGVVTLGLPPSLGATLSARLVRRFQERHPQARLKIVVAFSGALLEWLEAGRVDVGVLYDARRSHTLLVTPLLREDLHLIEAQNGRPSPPDAELSELGEGAFVISCSANGMRRIVDAAAARLNIEMTISAEIDSLDALKELVEIGPDRSILPFGAVHREVKAGRLRARRFRDPQMQALLVLATPLHQPVTRLASAVLQLIEEEVERGIADGVLSGVSGGALRQALADRSAGASDALYERSA